MDFYRSHGYVLNMSFTLDSVFHGLLDVGQALFPKHKVMFDYPTVADLTDFIVAQFSEGEEEEALLGGSRELNANEAMATIGMAARFPGCHGNGGNEPPGLRACPVSQGFSGPFEWPKGSEGRAVWRGIGP